MNLSQETSVDLTTWNRARSIEEMRSFVNTRFSALAEVEVE